MTLSSELRLGANLMSNGSCSFLVWCPNHHAVTLEVCSPAAGKLEMNPLDKSYFHCSVPNVKPGALYSYVLPNGAKRPDPASKAQPQGVHGPSQVCSDSFHWTDSSWRGISLDETILYEVHVGTFTPEGTFDAILPRLPALKSLGITTIELMPLAQFPGERNWGYDGVYLFAVQNSYGGRDGLKRLVNACHELGLAVALDVVYNHFGPEGNYLSEFGPYFTDCYNTPWGEAVNFDGPHSEEVRRFFTENALHWLTDFHIDALRLDAIHAIIDVSTKRFLEELGQRIDEVAQRLNRKIHIIAENDRNDSRVILPRDSGGYGFASQWNDDFHHSVHALLTGERQGYYGDFGALEHVAKSLREGYVYSGQYSQFRHRRQGSFSEASTPKNFVNFIQNHDQVGNRAQGERLSQLVSFESLKLAAGLLLLSPFVPMLFMGEEYGETAPFQYFVSHMDENLIESVRQGRRTEFEKFDWRADVPDPQSADTFLRSKLHWECRDRGHHQKLLFFYAELLRLRKSSSSLSISERNECAISILDPVGLMVDRWHAGDRTIALYNFEQAALSINPCLPSGVWKKLLDSSDEMWNGPGCAVPSELHGGKALTLQLSPLSFALFKFVEEVPASGQTTA